MTAPRSVGPRRSVSVVLTIVTDGVTLTDVTKDCMMGEPVHALADLSLELPRSSYTAVMGPSGSGKSP